MKSAREGEKSPNEEKQRMKERLEMKTTDMNQEALKKERQKARERKNIKVRNVFSVKTKRKVSNLSPSLASLESYKPVRMS